MSRRARRYAEATAAKLVSLEPSPEDCCDHGLPWEDHCPLCEAEMADIVGEMEDEWTQERRVQ